MNSPAVVAYLSRIHDFVECLWKLPQDSKAGEEVRVRFNLDDSGRHSFLMIEGSPSSQRFSQAVIEVMQDPDLYPPLDPTTSCLANTTVRMSFESPGAGSLHQRPRCTYAALHEGSFDIEKPDGAATRLSGVAVARLGLARSGTRFRNHFLRRVDRVARVVFVVDSPAPELNPTPYDVPPGTWIVHIKGLIETSYGRNSPGYGRAHHAYLYFDDDTGNLFALYTFASPLAPR